MQTNKLKTSSSYKMTSFQENLASKLPKDSAIRAAIMLRMSEHFKLMGINLPDDKQAQRELIANYNKMICEKNPAFPANVDFVRTYHAFFSAIESGFVEKPLRSAFAYGQAFRDWARTADIANTYGVVRLNQLQAPKSEISAEQLYRQSTDQQLQETQAGFVAMIETKSALLKSATTKALVIALIAEMKKRNLPIAKTLINEPD